MKFGKMRYRLRENSVLWLAFGAITGTFWGVVCVEIFKAWFQIY